MCFRPAATAAPKICPKCGQINPVIADVCIECKTPLEDDRIACPRCGEMNDASLTECFECGEDLTSVKGNAGNAAPPIAMPGVPPAKAPMPAPPKMPGAPTAPSAPSIKKPQE